MSEDDKDLLNQQGKEKKIDTSTSTTTSEESKEVDKSFQNQENKEEESIKQTTNTENLIHENQSEIPTEEVKSVNLNKLNIQKRTLIDFIDEDFHSKVKNEEVSILLFGSSWCQPCKILKPIMEKLSEEYKDKVNFYYADIDEKALNTATSIAGVRGVPTVVVYKKGVEVARKVGGVPESHMRDFLKSNI